MSLLVTNDFAKQNGVIKRAVYHSNFPNFIKASFACALVSGKPLSKDTMLESSQIERMIEVANDDLHDVATREIISNYLQGINGMSTDLEVSDKVQEQHTFTQSQLVPILCELEHYHGGALPFSQILADNHSDSDIDALINLVVLV